MTTTQVEDRLANPNGTRSTARKPRAPGGRKRGRKSSKQRTRTVWAYRIAIVAVVVLGWQFVQSIPGITKVFTFESSFYISSPSKIAHQLWLLMFHGTGQTQLWSPLARSVLTAILGTAVAVVLGLLAGLAVSNWSILEMVSRPFIVILNAIPRIAMIPIIVIIMGQSAKADATTAVTVVFFLIFYNANAGASSVPIEMIHSAELLGASKYGVMWKVRFPYALGWTMATLPNAIAFGLVGTVTAELFSGSGGLGYLMSIAVDNANSTLLFAVVVALAFIGVVLVLGTSALQRVLLPWWEESQGA